MPATPTSNVLHTAMQLQGCVESSLTELLAYNMAAHVQRL
jgi:hypothetical protein